MKPGYKISSSPKRICLILPGKLPVPNIKGGAIETLLTLLINQNEIYKKVHFIIICPWVEGIDTVAAQYKNTEFHFFKIRKGIWKKAINGINYIIARITGNIDFFKTPMHYDIENLMKEVEADSVIVEHGIYKHFKFLSKYFKREQLYLHIHGIGPMMDKATKKTFGHFIAVSEFVKNLYINGFEEYHTKFHVCYNGIDDELFRQTISKKERAELRKKFGVRDSDLLIIYCGRLVREKGVKEIITGVIKTNSDNIKLMLVGGSNFEDSSLTGYVKELYDLVKKNSERVFFTGYIPNKELYRYYHISDLQVICSICEDAAPLVSVEGIMAGLPLIVTDSGGILEYAGKNAIAILKKGNALTDRKDAKKLSEQLTTTLNKISTGELSINVPASDSRFRAYDFYTDFVKIVCET